MLPPAADPNLASATLVPLTGTVGPTVVLPSQTVVTIGAGDDHIRVTEPGIGPRHCVLMRDASRWIVMEAARGVSVNGHALAGATRLFDRDVLALSATLRWEFVSGEQRTQELPVSEKPLLSRITGRRRRIERFNTTSGPLSRRISPLVVLAGLLLVLASGGLWYSQRDRLLGEVVLNDDQSIALDSLLVQAYDHLERGNSLLEMGMPDEAGTEFARGINTLALSPLRDHPIVRPRIDALEGTVADLYRANQLTVPEEFMRANSGLRAEGIRTAVLTREQFSHAFDLVSGAFRLRFGRSIVVVGRDHPEHRALYGNGGALDLRTSNLSSEQVAFIVGQALSYGIRVKDFSQDSILRRQVAAARRAGLGERAGTGLHLHIDRFADRRDRWTVVAAP